MKIEELVTIVKELSMEEIDALVERGIKIVNIFLFIWFDDKQMKEILFRNEKLRRIILKEVNSHVLYLFEEINKDPNRELSPNFKKICKNYLKSFFLEGIDLELTSEKGRKLVDLILEAKNNKQFIKDAFIESESWGKYVYTLRMLSRKNMNELSTQQAEEYLLTFGQAMRIIISGYNIPEAEAILKLVQRNDIDIVHISKLDIFASIYKDYRSQGKIACMDEVFSIILDKDILQRKNRIEKKGEYSPINEMVQAIMDDTFGENNVLTKEEFAFAFKMMQNPELLDAQMNKRIEDILTNPEIQLSLGKREFDTLLTNQEMFAKLIEKMPHNENDILKQIDANVYNILVDISKKQRKITAEEMDICSMYFEHYYEKSLSKHGDTVEMAKLTSLIMDLSEPYEEYNINGVKKQKATTEFFERRVSEVFSKYDDQIKKMVKRLKSDEPMTIEEFKQYDEIWYEFSFKIVQDDIENIDIINPMEKRSKQLQVRSKTLENQIDMYIDKCLNLRGFFNEKSFFNVIMQYYETQLEGSALEINQNSAIAHLISAARKRILPIELSNTVLEKLEERNKKSPVFIQVDNTIDIDEYMPKVAEIRLQFGKMPPECCDFIIKQAILNKNDMAKYEGMIERAFEDFTEYELADSNIYGYYCRVLAQQFFVDKNDMGLHNGDKKLIKLSRQKIKSKGILETINTIIHEKTHAEQDIQLKSSVLNRDTYRMLKERILLKENHNFYNDNYFFMYDEIDARKGGYLKRIKTLWRMGFSTSEIVELQAANIQEKIEEYCQQCESGKIKKLGDKTKSVNELFFEQLQSKPDLIDRHPVLHIEFERIGDEIQIRSFANILATYEKMLRQAKSQIEIEKISSLCSEILLNGRDVLEEEMQEELAQLMAFNSENPIINAYKNKVLKTKFPKGMVMMSSMNSMYNKHSAQEREKVRQSLNVAAQDKRVEINQPEGSGEGRDE